VASSSYLAAPERRRQILDSAKRVFAKRGYHDTNISHICEDLRIARGTLYQYFESKQDVFSAVIRDMLDRLRAAVAAEPPIEIPPGFRPTRDQAIRYAAASLRRVLEAIFEDEASLRILVREAVGLDVGIDKILRSIDDVVVDRCASDLAAAKRAGILRADVDPRTAALFILGGVQKLALHALGRDKRGRVDLRALALEATKLNMMGLLSDEVPR
jgi:AcrR family transcriptional regulator